MSQLTIYDQLRFNYGKAFHNKSTFEASFLEDSYIADLIISNSELKRSDVYKIHELIRIKRYLILIQRLLKS